MARCYMQVYYDFIHSLEPLSDGETGRLFIAMLQYAQQGTLPDFRGNERFIWPTIKAQIDRDHARYDEISQSRSEAGKLGGRPKASGLSGKQTGQAQSTKSIKSHEEKKDNDEKNHQDDDKDSNISTGNSGGGSHPLTTKEKAMENVVAWSAVFDMAQKIGIPDTIADRIKCDALIAEYSVDWMNEAIKRAGNAPASARSWRYIEGILRKWRKIGKIDDSKPPDSRIGKTVIEQQYHQRDYGNKIFCELTPEEIMEAQQYEV